MIGGLRQLRMSDSMSGVPWFCQIPVIGWLFKNKENSDDKTQLVLFVTPSIIEEPTLTTEEKAQLRPHRYQVASSRLLLRRWSRPPRKKE